MWKLIKTYSFHNKISKIYLGIICFLFLSVIFKPTSVQGQSDIVAQIDSLIDLAEYENAIQFTEKTIESQVAEDSVKAIYFHKLGLCFYQLYNNETALTQFNKALKIRQQIFKPTHKDIIRLYRNISVVQNEIGNISEASLALEQALVLLRQSSMPDTSLIVDLYMQQGRLLAKNREYNRAKEYLLQGKFLCEEYSKIKKESYVEVLELLATNALAVNDTFQIIHWANQAAKFIESELNSQDQYQFYLANAFHNLGTGYALLDSFNLSNENFEKSLNINRKGGTERSFYVSYDLSNLALNYKNKSQFDTALKLIKEAVKIDLENEDLLELSSNYENMAAILLDGAQLNSAKEIIEKGIHLLDKYPYLEEDKHNSIQLLLTKANIEKEVWKTTKKNKEAVLEITDRLIEVLRNIRQSFLTDESKLVLQEKGKEIYDVLVESLVLIYETQHDENLLEKAFALADDAKSLVLFESVMYNNTLDLPGIPEYLIEKELSLRKTISELEYQLHNENEDKNVQNLLILAREKLQLHRRTSKEQNENYRLLSQVYQAEQKDERFEHFVDPLFEFYLGASSAFLFYKNAHQMKVYRLSSIDEIYHKCKRVKAHISKVNSIGLSEKQIQDQNKIFAQDAFDLYQLLFKSFLDEWNQLPEKFIVVPDEILNYVPIEALLDEVVTDDFGLVSDFPFLLKKHIIQTVFSSKLNNFLSTKESGGKAHRIISFAPSFSASRNGSERSGTGQFYSELLYNKKEIKGISKIAASHLYIDRFASKTNFLKHISNAGVVHLATHAWADQNNSSQSHIAFAPDQKQINDQSAQSNLLYIHEIQNLDLDASLVTLSACDTGAGVYRKGEGVVSLGRAFIYAGAQSTLMTLWKVDDQSTSDICISFYKQLQLGATKDEALRNAKLDFLDRYKNKSLPYYWAALIIKGNTDSLSLVEHNNNNLYLLIGLFILIALILKYKYSSSKRNPKDHPG